MEYIIKCKKGGSEESINFCAFVVAVGDALENYLKKQIKKVRKPYKKKEE